MLLILEIVAAMFISRILYGAYRQWSEKRGYSPLKPLFSVLLIVGGIMVLYFLVMGIWVYKIERTEAKEPCHVGYEMCLPGQARVYTPPNR